MISYDIYFFQPQWIQLLWLAVTVPTMTRKWRRLQSWSLCVISRFHPWSKTRPELQSFFGTPIRNTLWKLSLVTWKTVWKIDRVRQQALFEAWAGQYYVQSPQPSYEAKRRWSHGVKVVGVDVGNRRQMRTEVPVSTRDCESDLNLRNTIRAVSFSGSNIDFGSHSFVFGSGRVELQMDKRITMTLYMKGEQKVGSSVDFEAEPISD